MAVRFSAVWGARGLTSRVHSIFNKLPHLPSASPKRDNNIPAPKAGVSTFRATHQGALHSPIGLGKSLRAVTASHDIAVSASLAAFKGEGTLGNQVIHNFFLPASSSISSTPALGFHSEAHQDPGHQHGSKRRGNRGLPAGLAAVLMPFGLFTASQVARCADFDDEEDQIMEEAAEKARRVAEEEEADEDEPRGADSNDDEPIDDVDGSDPEDETEQQSRAIESAYANLQKGATQKIYGGGTRYYRKWWSKRTGGRIPAVTLSGVGKFVLAKKKRSHSWINSHIKAFQWAYRTYPRRADAIVQDLRKLKAVQDVLKAAKERDANQSKEEYQDRQKGLSQGYTTEQYEQLSKYWLNFLRAGRRQQKGEPPAYTAIHLRTDFLWLNTALGRGQDASNRQLPDQFSYNLQFVGPDVADVFATVTRNGKTNQNGRAEFIGAMRHRNVVNCCVGAEAMRSFYRYHVQDRAETSCPDFSSRRAWYNTPVAPGRATKKKQEKGSQGITYQTYYDYFKKAFQAHGITSDKVVHAGRGHGARAAAAAGAKEREIQGLGRWTYAQFDMSYLTSLPTKALIIQAGFTKDWMDRRPLMQTYVIPRSRVLPPEELLQMVFPWLDETLAVVKKRNLEQPARARDIAAEAYLVRLGKERIIFLQDAAVLWDGWKDLVIYQDPVFKHPLWQKFREDVLEMCERVKDDSEAETYNLPREVAAAIRSQEDRLGGLLEALAKTKEQEIHAQQERDEALREQMNAQHSELVSRLTSTIQALAVHPATCESCGHHQARPSIPDLQPGTSTAPATDCADGAGPSGTAGGQAQGAELPVEPRVQYLDPARLLTVNDVRKEFEEDGPDGRRSINGMDKDDPKLRWRNDFGVDRRRLGDLKVLYDAVVVLAKQEGSSRETAAMKLESWRRRDKDSLRQFFYKIRALRVLAKGKHATATEEVKGGRIERAFADLLAQHCLDC